MATPMIERKPTTPTTPDRRRSDFCARVRSAQQQLRDALAEFLAQPSSAAFEALRREGIHYIEFERQSLLPAAQRAHAPDDALEGLRVNHDAVVRAFNTVLWDTPGSYQLCSDAHTLRHALLQQIELCERSICPALATLDARAYPTISVAS